MASEAELVPVVVVTGPTASGKTSIGIEIVNPGHAGGCPDFCEPQVEAVEGGGGLRQGGETA